MRKNHATDMSRKAEWKTFPSNATTREANSCGNVPEPWHATEPQRDETCSSVRTVDLTKAHPPSKIIA